MKHGLVLSVSVLCVVIFAGSCLSRSDRSLTPLSSAPKTDEGSGPPVRGSVRHLVESGELKNPYELVTALKRTYVVFVHSSRSDQQFASVEFPRMILFSRYGDAIYTVAGNPDHASILTVESIEWNESLARFETFLFDFSSPERPEIIENPRQCAQCHGEDPVPLWDSYPVWPGVFGSEHQPVDGKNHEAYESEIWSRFVKRVRTSDPKEVYSLLQPESLALSELTGMNTLFGKVLSRQLATRLYARFADKLSVPQLQPLGQAFLSIPFDFRSPPSQDEQKEDRVPVGLEHYFEELASATGESRSDLLSEWLQIKNEIGAQQRAAHKSKLARLNVLRGRYAATEITFYEQNTQDWAALMQLSRRVPLKLGRWWSQFLPHEFNTSDGLEDVNLIKRLMNGDQKAVERYPAPDQFDRLPW